MAEETLLSQSNIDAITEVVSGLPAFIDCLEITAFERETIWTVSVEIDVTVLIEGFAPGLVLLSTEVGALPHEHEVRLFPLLLGTNTLAHRSSGTFFGWSPKDRMVELSQIVSFDGITPQSLSRTIKRLLDIRHDWAAILRNPSHQEREQPAASDFVFKA